MKNLLVIPMLFYCFIGMSQVADSASVIGKSIRIGDLVVAQYDFPKVMNWSDAKKACATLGKGWRLPTQYELNILFKNKDKIGGFKNNRYYYWNSKLYSEGLRWTVDFSDGGYPYAEFESKDNNVRAVRSFFVSDKEFIIDSASVIGKSIRVGNLVVAQYDFPDEMIMNDAIKACTALGKGWRLPTKNELNILFKNKDKIGGFTVNGSYQSSTRLDYYDTWDQTFFNGNQGYGGNYWPHNIRAVRDLYVRDIDSASMIIGKVIRIGNLVVAQNDIPKLMNWSDAKKACAALGKGWRLPTKDELYILYKNKDKIGGFDPGFYWSSTEDNRNNPWSQTFSDGYQYHGIGSQVYKYGVRAVRTLK